MFEVSFLSAGSTCSADLGMIKPPESVNTATDPFSTKLSTESSGRRTYAASNAILTLAPSLVADVLNAVACTTRGSLTDPGLTGPLGKLRRLRHCPPSPSLHCVWIHDSSISANSTDRIQDSLAQALSVPKSSDPMSTAATAYFTPYLCAASFFAACFSFLFHRRGSFQ